MKKRRFGVNLFIDDIHVETQDVSDSFKSPEFKYVIEIVNENSHDGNGLDLMKIYTNGKLEIFRVGNWRVSPIVKMPFSWRGYWDEIEMVDNNNVTAKIRHQPDQSSIYKKICFKPDIYWVFETINELLLIEDNEHFELIKQIREVNRLNQIKKGIWKERPFGVGQMKEACDMLEGVISEFQRQKSRLKPEYNEHLKRKINEQINTFNEFRVELIE